MRLPGWDRANRNYQNISIEQLKLPRGRRQDEISLEISQGGIEVLMESGNRLGVRIFHAPPGPGTTVVLELLIKPFSQDVHGMPPSENVEKA